VHAYLQLGRALGARHYLAAQRLRTRLYEEMRGALGAADLLATPTTTLPAPAIDTLDTLDGGIEPGTIDALTRLTGPFNLTGLPALSVPCGFTASGLPIGLQLVGRPFGEADLLAAGHAFQQATEWHRRRPVLG
jgi:aspartyl-tRNA(Asn)/glutamyl-tRNA(Gln) amidotransferase subunit A